MRRSTLALTALLFSCFGSAAAPALAELKIDGVAAPAEWSGAVAHPLAGGGEVMLKLSSGFLDLAVRGEGDGWAHVYLADAHRILVLHASAALGAAEYRPEGDGWSAVRDFEWGMRDPSLSAAAIEERRQHLEREGWVASTSRMGEEGVIEVRVDRRLIADPASRIAVVFAADASSPHPWPSGLADATLEEMLLFGRAPESLRFDPASWSELPAERTEAEARVEAMLDALGGRERWANLESLYIRAVHTEPQLDEPYRSEIWRNLGVPQFKVVQQGVRGGVPFRSVRVVNGKHGWSVREGVVEPISDSALAALLHWDAHLVYATLRTLARGEEHVQVRIDERDRLLVLRDGSLLAAMELDSQHRPHRYYTPDAGGDGESLVRYTQWGESAGFVHPVVSEIPTGAVFRADAWKPSRRPSDQRFEAPAG